MNFVFMHFIQILKNITITPRVKVVIKVIITLSLLFYLFLKLDINLISELLLSINPWLFILAFTIALSRNIFGGFRWKILLRTKKYHFSVIGLTKYYLISLYFNFFLPTAVGGDVARGYYLSKQGVGKKDVIGSIIIERALGIAALVSFSTLSLFFCYNVINSKIKIIVIILDICCLTLVFFYEKTDLLLEKILPDSIIRKLQKLFNLIQNIKDYGKSPTILLYGFFVSIIFQVFSIFSIYLISISLGSSVSFIYFLLLLPIIWLITMIPITINGLGLREGAFIFLFTEIGMAKEMAMAISLLFLLQTIIQGMIGGIFFLLERDSLVRHI